MRKLFLYLTLCFAPLCWGQGTDVLSDWGDWSKVVDEQSQPELLHEELAPTSEQPSAFQHADRKADDSAKQPTHFGVGLVGDDERQLNVLDGSSLMDYDESQGVFAGQEGGALDEGFFTDEYILDLFDEDAELTLDEFDTRGEFDGFEVFDVVNDPESIETLEPFDDGEIFADEPEPVEEPIFIE